MSIMQNKTIPLLRVTGYWLIAIGVIHVIGDIVYYLKPWSDIFHNGVFNAVDPYFDRGAAFWMLMLSPFIFTLSQFCFWAEEHNVRLPSFMGWNLLTTSAFGVFLMPISGFWLLIPPSIFIIVASQSREVNSSQAIEDV
jgi:Family of unknown function (DUF6463)